MLTAIALTGCDNGKDKAFDEGGFLHPPISNFLGFFASEGGVGRMNVAIHVVPSSLAPAWNASGASVEATASIVPEIGAAVALIGTYDTALDSLHLEGSGYEFGGHVAWRNGVPEATGSFTSPGDDGAFAVALINSYGPQVFCGQLLATGDTQVGRLGYVISGVVVLGAACFSSDLGAVPVEGELDRTTAKPRLTMTGATGWRSVDMHGTLDEEAELSAGSWTSSGGSGDAVGTWSAALCP
jgi:hypothetical protein